MESISKANEQYLYSKVVKDTSRLKNGCKLLYMGKMYTLEVFQMGKKPNVYIDGEFIIACLPSLKDGEILKNTINNFYREQARKVFDKKCKYYSGIMQVTFNRIAIKEQKTRWGSCSQKGNLNFNCKVVKAPEDVIDYLVVHELAHRKEMNHSDRFWGEVEKILPNYKEAKQWLKLNGGYL